MKALSGVTVIDLTSAIAGPFCTMMMGDLGADVIKVEQLDVGDVLRRTNPLFQGETPVFTAYNRNKKSIALDLNQAEGVNLVKRLASKAQVLIDSAPPGKMEALGLDYNSLKTENPGLICASLTGFGNVGPYRDRPIYEGTLQAECGMTRSLINDSQGTPYLVGGNLGQVSSAYLCLTAILGALHQRNATGRGQQVETSMYSSLLAMFSLPINDYLFNGVECPVDGHAPQGFIRSKDGWLRISCGDQPIWERAVKLFNDPVLNEARFKDVEERDQNRKLLLSRVENWSLQYTSEAAVALFTQAGISGGMVRTLSDLRHNPHLAARGHIVEIEVPGQGTLPFFGSPFRMQHSPVDYLPAPILGADGDRILSELLGMNTDERAALKKAGILA